MGVISDLEYKRYWEFVVGSTPTTGPFPINFPFRDVDEVKVYIGGAFEPGYSVVQPTEFGIEGNEVVLDNPVSDVLLVIASDVGATRTLGENFVASELSVELDRVFALFQEIKDTETRTLRLRAGADAIEEIGDVAEGRALIRTPTGFGAGPNASEIAAAQTQASLAGTARDEAQAAATAAGLDAGLAVQASEVAQASVDTINAKITMSPDDPSGGSNGDIWFKYTPS